MLTGSHVALCCVHHGEVRPGEIVEVIPARLTLRLELPHHEHGAVGGKSKIQRTHIKGDKFGDITPSCK